MEDVINNIDRLISSFENLGNTGVDIEIDKDGYLDRECPNKVCRYAFKVFEQDWIDLFKDEKLFCPKCRQSGESDAFCSSGHIILIDEGIQQIIDDAMNGWNIPLNSLDSVPALKIFITKHQCEKCSMRYSGIGTTYFCPCCGHNSILKTFEDTLNMVEIKMSNIPLILGKIIESNNEDQAEMITSSLIETSLSELVGGFQRYLEERYFQLTHNSLKRNPFQNLERGSNAWRDSFNLEYSDFLSMEELKTLNVAFQIRHLLQHNEGIVDLKYIDKSEDKTYEVGQRIVINTDFIILIKQIIKSLVSLMNHKINEVTS